MEGTLVFVLGIEEVKVRNNSTEDEGFWNRIQDRDVTIIYLYHY